MNRFSKRTSHYIPQDEATARTFKLLINKTTAELGGLFVVLVGLVSLVSSHSYFSINDIKIDGLDAYAAEKARDVIDAQLNANYSRSYVFVSEKKILAALQQELALDTSTVEKKFPHTLRVRANEVPLRMRFVAPNGQAYVSDTGELVRWYSTTSTPQLLPNEPIIFVPQEITQRAVLQQVVDQKTLDNVRAIHLQASRISRARLTGILLSDTSTDRAELIFERSAKVITKQSADMTIQLRKAALAAEKYQNAKTIDVRFADKVFVTF